MAKSDAVENFLALLGDPLDPSPSGNMYEDIFDVCAHCPPSRNLGFIDRSTQSLTVNVNGNDFTISQSPSILASDRKGGTTGAVLWSLTPLFAQYLLSSTNPLRPLLAGSTILELGAGVSAVIPLALSSPSPPSSSSSTSSTYVPPRRIISSDQPYVLKLARHNLETNLEGRYRLVRDEARPVFVSFRVDPAAAPASAPSKARKAAAGGGRKSVGSAANAGMGSPTGMASTTATTIDLISLDWELDSLKHHPAFMVPSPSSSSSTHHKGPGAAGRGEGRDITIVLAIDCIYNEALIPPLLDTCVSACLLHADNGGGNDINNKNNINNNDYNINENNTLVIIALEIRSSEVLEFFLEAFTDRFTVWRVPDAVLTEELKSGVGEGEGGEENKGSGYVVYCGVLKDEVWNQRR